MTEARPAGSAVGSHKRRVWIALFVWAALSCVLLGWLDAFGALARLATVAAIGGAVAVVGYAASHWRGWQGSVTGFTVLFVAVGLTLGEGRAAGRWGCFMLARRGMEREIARARAGESPATSRTRIEKAADGGSLRAAFVRAGVLDRWCGWVYDGDGRLAASVGPDGAVRGDAADWFGGGMVRAERVSGPWWCCWFK